MSFATRDCSPWILASGLFPLAILWLGMDQVLQHGPAAFPTRPLWVLLLFISVFHPLVAKLKVEQRGLVKTIFGLPTLRVAWRDVKEARVRRFYISFRTQRFLPVVVCPTDKEGFLRSIRAVKPGLPILQG